MRRILAVARNTFREAVRNKVLYSLLVFALALIVSSLALGELSVHEETRTVLDVGLFGVDLFGVLIAVFVGVNLLYKELALKTVYTILAKPIARWEFVLGKWLGVMATLAVQVAVMGVVLALTLTFQGGFGTAGSALPKALWLLFVNVTIVTSVAMLFSSFTSPFLSGVFSLGVFVLGRSVPDVRALGDRMGGAGGTALRGLCAVLPNLHLYYPSGAIVGSDWGSPWGSAPSAGLGVSLHQTYVGASYLGWTTAYGLGYSALVLALAMFVFARRDFV
jgi:ABC-type transport system involved in multi-copper enzyme maturation permease subunit